MPLRASPHKVESYMRNTIASLSEKLTIFILTYNRYPRLIRALKYVDSVGSPYRIYVLDSSRPHMSLTKYDAVLKRNNITHLLFDCELHPFEKIQQALKYVTTPYVVLWADDDFMVLPALKEGIKFLESKHDYNLVHGQACLFSMDYEKAGGKVTGISPYPQREITDDTAAKRLLNHLGCYTTTYYSIHRKENYQRIVELLQIFF